MTCVTSHMAVLESMWLLAILVSPPRLHVLGADCSLVCPPEDCDNVTGICVMERTSSGDFKLLTDKLGKADCPSGLFGENCSKVCPSNCVNGTCDVDTGQCTAGCVPGYTGQDCSKECPGGVHGQGCLLSCPANCRHGSCNPQSGVCLDGCVDGYWGSDCSLGVDLSRSSHKERRNFYKNLSAEGKSILLYVLASQYEHELARAQFEIERAVHHRNEIQHVLSDIAASEKQTGPDISYAR